MPARLIQIEAVMIMLKAGLRPLEPYPGAGKPWRCTHTACGNETSPRYNGLLQGEGGCKFCGGRITDVNAQAEVLAEKRLVPLEPYQSIRAPWKCLHETCGNEITIRWGNVKNGQGFCKHCSELNYVEKHDVPSTVAAAGFTPLEPYPGDVGKKWRLKHHACGHEVELPYRHLTSRGCKYCKGVAIHPDDAVTLMRDHGYEPLADYPGANAKWLSRCTTCQEESSPNYTLVKTRHQIGSGCSHCQKKCPKDCECSVRRGTGTP